VDLDFLDQWISPGRYVSGREFAEAGLAELVPLDGIAASSGSTQTGWLRGEKGNGEAVARVSVHSS
jgi:hypothetical protein